MQVLNFFCLNLFKDTNVAVTRFGTQKGFKVTVSIRINAGAFIKFFNFLEAIYSREVFNRSCFTISHDQPNMN